MKNPRKKIFTFVLSMFLLLVHASSLSALTAEAGAAPLGGNHRLQAAGETAGFRLPANPSNNIGIGGALRKLDNGNLRLTSQGDEAPYLEIELIITGATLILDETSGSPVPATELKDGEKIYAYIFASSDGDLPPQVNALAVLCHLNEEKALPGCFEVRSVISSEDGSVKLVTDKDMVLQVEVPTMPEAFKTPLALEKITSDQLVPGTRILAWYPAVSLSMPAQSSPSRVIALPYDYNGYVELTPEGKLYVNGKILAWGNKAEPYRNEQGYTMLPLRKLYEALGYTVTWDSAVSSIIMWYEDAREFGFLFDLSHAGKMAELGGTITNSATEIQVVDGITFVSVDDLAKLSNVMFARGNQQ